MFELEVAGWFSKKHRKQKTKAVHNICGSKPNKAECSQNRNFAVSDYVWTPTECDLPAFSPDLFCTLTEKRPVVFVGDMVMAQAYASVGNAIRNEQWRAGGEYDGCVDRINFVNSTEFFSDRILDQPTSSYAFLPHKSILILHDQPNAGTPSDHQLQKYSAFLKELLQLFAKDRSDVKILWRSATPTHPSCSKYEQPFVHYTDYAKVVDKFARRQRAQRADSYYSLKRKTSTRKTEDEVNAHLMHLMAELNIPVIDLKPLQLRPDAHSSSKDCKSWAGPIGALEVFPRLVQYHLQKNVFGEGDVKNAMQKQYTDKKMSNKMQSKDGKKGWGGWFTSWFDEQPGQEGTVMQDMHLQLEEVEYPKYRTDESSEKLWPEPIVKQSLDNEVEEERAPRREIVTHAKRHQHDQQSPFQQSLEDLDKTLTKHNNEEESHPPMKKRVHAKSKSAGIEKEAAKLSKKQLRILQQKVPDPKNSWGEWALKAFMGSDYGKFRADRVSELKKKFFKENQRALRNKLQRVETEEVTTEAATQQAEKVTMEHESKDSQDTPFGVNKDDEAWEQHSFESLPDGSEQKFQAFPAVSSSTAEHESESESGEHPSRFPINLAKRTESPHHRRGSSQRVHESIQKASEREMQRLKDENKKLSWKEYGTKLLLGEDYDDWKDNQLRMNIQKQKQEEPKHESPHKSHKRVFENYQKSEEHESKHKSHHKKHASKKSFEVDSDDVHKKRMTINLKEGEENPINIPLPSPLSAVVPNDYVDQKYHKQQFRQITSKAQENGDQTTFDLRPKTWKEYFHALLLGEDWEPYQAKHLARKAGHRRRLMQKRELEADYKYQQKFGQQEESLHDPLDRRSVSEQTALDQDLSEESGETNSIHLSEASTQSHPYQDSVKTLYEQESKPLMVKRIKEASASKAKYLLLAEKKAAESAKKMLAKEKKIAEEQRKKLEKQEKALLKKKQQRSKKLHSKKHTSHKHESNEGTPFGSETHEGLDMKLFQLPQLEADKQHKYSNSRTFESVSDSGSSGESTMIYEPVAPKTKQHRQRSHHNMFETAKSKYGAETLRDHLKQTKLRLRQMPKSSGGDSWDMIGAHAQPVWGGWSTDNWVDHSMQHDPVGAELSARKRVPTIDALSSQPSSVKWTNLQQRRQQKSQDISTLPEGGTASFLRSFGESVDQFNDVMNSFSPDNNLFHNDAPMYRSQRVHSAIQRAARRELD